MAVVVVGGHSRNVGKTSVVAGLIAGMPERRWTAVKITQYEHGTCPIHGRSCRCEADEHTWTLDEEHDPAGRGDTCRFLRAGAQRALWVRTKPGHVADALPALRQALAAAENVIFESNSLMQFVQPDVYVTVLDMATRDFKASAREFLPLATAVVLHEPPAQDLVPAWEDASLEMIGDKPVFRVRPPEYVTTEIVTFVRERISHSRKSGANGIWRGPRSG